MINTPTPIRTRPSRDSCPPPTRRRRLAASAPRPTVELAPRTVEQIAQRVTQLLRQHQLTTKTNPPPAPASLLTVKELAQHLKVNPAWVYEHAQELGAIRTGNGPKARMRFDLHTATQALKPHHQGTTPIRVPGPRPSKPMRPRPYGSDAPALKVRDPYERGVRGLFARVHRRGAGVR